MTTSSFVWGLAVPTPTFPLPCWRTNCELPMVNPWPDASVVVPLVLVNCPRPKYPVPLAVMLVVLAPPDIVNSPDVIVEEAFERNPLVNVARPVCVRVPERVVSPLTVRAPRVASCEKRLVEDAVVENRFVVVPAVSESVPSVERPVTSSVEESVVAPEAASVPTLAA